MHTRENAVFVFGYFMAAPYSIVPAILIEPASYKRLMDDRRWLENGAIVIHSADRESKSVECAWSACFIGGTAAQLKQLIRRESSHTT